MERFVARQNIQHFKDMLAAEADPSRRDLLEQMIAEEEAKLVGQNGAVGQGGEGESRRQAASGEVAHAQQRPDLTPSPKR